MADLQDPQLRLELLREHYQEPRHRGRMEEADVVMPGGNPGCGDVVVIFLKAEGDRLQDVRFEGRGCTVSQAATSMLLEQLHREGLSAERVQELDVHHMEELLGADLVRARPRCATLGLATLKGAVAAWQRRRRARELGVELAPEPSQQEVDGLVLGADAWEAAGQQPHE